MSLSGFEGAVCREIEILYRVAFRLTQHHDDAEDLVGQTLLKAASAWPTFDGRHLRSWLIRILRNAYSNSLRNPGSATLLTDLPSQLDVHREVAERIEHAAILLALNQLPRDQRLAIVLCDIEELSYGDAAIALGVPLGTLQSRLFRARKSLRNHLDYLPDGPPLRLRKPFHATS